MRKILFFSATLVAMVFMAFSFNSCKKEKTDTNSLSGTRWNHISDGNDMILTFTSTTTLTLTNIGISPANATYTYDNATKTGTVTFNATTAWNIKISNDTLYRVGAKATLSDGKSVDWFATKIK